MIRVSILGSTGSIGVQALDVIEQLGPEYQVVGLAAGRNVDLLAEQIRRWRPAIASVAQEADRARLAEDLGGGVELASGDAGLEAVASWPEADVVITAVTGARGLRPVVSALQAGKRVAPANKEPLVVAGALLMRLAEANGTPLVPIDSEHSAIFQCLAGEDRASVSRLLLTASGGPFRGRTRDELQGITAAQALRHPTWTMGAKITIDSATLFNKGLEIIEAQHLFGLPVEQIDVVLHPQSIVHSLVEFVDGSLKAQLDYPDMRTPIQYALTWPARVTSPRPRLDLASCPPLTFEAPDRETFRCLDLAYEAARTGGLAPCAMNAADEIAVDRFLGGQIGFLDIATVVERVMARAPAVPEPDLDALLACDEQARRHATEECAACSS